MIAFEDARARLLALANPVGAERVALVAALGRVLAEDVAAPRDVPAVDHSTMDGYAVRLSDFEGDGPYRLRVTGECRTGRRAEPLVAGVARIFTGAELPANADAVVMQEEVTRDGPWALFDARPRPHALVRRRGADLRAGDVPIAAGTALGPATLGLAAMLDRAWLLVARRPVVTLVATGDELRSPGTPELPGTLPDCNAVAIEAIARRAGATVRTAPLVRDDCAATESALEAALRCSDLVVTIGGASVGDHDVVRPSLERIGARIEFWRVAIKPGKPLLVGQRGATVVLGLPGNPASAIVTFALFGVPFLRALQGLREPFPKRRRGVLARAVDREPGRLEFLRAVAHEGPSGLTVTPHDNQASGALTSFIAANALACIPNEIAHLDVGAEVDVFFLGDLGL